MLFSNQLHFDTISSTNTYLKENYQRLNNYTVVSAHHQTNGRGRLNRQWIDDNDLLLSILIKDNLPVSEISKIGLVVVASIFNTISNHLNNLVIKWPNDILINGKKISGILLESIISNNTLVCLIIGIGINVNSTKFPKNLADTATSLSLENKSVINIEALKQEVLQDFEILYKSYMKNDSTYLDICRKNSCLIGREIMINDYQTQQKGRVLDILNNGSILIDVNNQIKEFNYGEISISP